MLLSQRVLYGMTAVVHPSYSGLITDRERQRLDPTIDIEPETTLDNSRRSGE